MKTVLCALFLTYASFLCSQTLSTSLVACYSLDGNANDPINALNGTLSAVTPTLDRFNNSGSAYAFSSAVASYIELPDDPLLKPSTAISISCWIKTSNASTQYIIFTKNPSTNNYEGYDIAIVAGKVRVQKSDGNTSNVADGTTNVATNTWYHVVGTIDNNALKVYVNGALENSAASTLSFTYQAGKKVILGRSNESSNFPYTGSIDNVKFYNRVLSAYEVSQLYTTDPSCSSLANLALSDNLNACYPFSNNANDMVSNLNGTLSAVTPTVDRFSNPNSAYAFSGSTLSYIELPNNPLIKPTSAITYACWVKVSSLPTNQYIVYTKNNVTSNFEAYCLSVANTGSSYSFRAQKGAGGSTDICTGTTTISLGTWYHVATTINNNSIKIYVNGVLEGTTATSIPFTYDATRNVILGGSKETNFNLPFFGSMDNVKFYDRALSSTEINNLYSTDPNCPTTPGPTLSTNLVACYALDGNANDPVSSLNGTVTAATPTVNRFNIPGTAYQFSGTGNTYIELPDDPLLKPLNALSISCWIKTSNASTQYIIFTKNPSTNNYEGYDIAIVAGKVRVQKSDGNTSNVADGTTNVATNTWYHVVGTIDNNTLKVYVNGTLENSAASTLSFTYQAGKKVILGRSNESSNFPYTGSLDNVRFYNRVLSASEVSQLYTTDPVCSAPPVASFSVSSLNTCVGITISVTDLSTNNPTSWNWQTPGASTASFSVANPFLSYASAGTYTVSLTSSNSIGSSNTVTQTIVVGNPPTITISSSSLISCAGKQTTLTASGANTYTWSTTQTGSQVIVTPTSTSVFTVTGTNNNCSSTATISQLVIANPSVTISSSNQTICANKNTTITANGASTYSWSTNQTLSQIVVSPTITTIYTVTGTDNNGCSTTKSVQLVITNPTVSVSSSSVLVCSGRPTTLTATGVTNYTWSTSQTGSQVVVFPAATGSYSVYGLDNNGCSGTATLTQVVLANPSVSLSTTNTLICSGTSVTMTANGATTYSWSTGQTTAQVTVTPTITTTYTAIGVDNNGCTNTANIQMAVMAKPTVTISATNPSICPGQSATLIANGATSYTWSTSLTSTQIVVNPTSTTNYTVTGTDNNGCTNTYTMQLLVTNPVLLVSSSSPTTCAGKPTTLTATGVSTFSWSTLQNSAQIIVSPVLTTTYNVSGHDIGGCLATASISQSVTPLPLIVAVSQNSVICAGKSATLSAFGCISYTWSTNQNISQIVVTPTANTTYSVTGSGNGGCTNSTTVVQLVTPLPTVNIVSSSSTLCPAQSVTLTATGANSYTWNNNQTTSVIVVNPVASTIYNVTGLNNAGCTNTANVTLSVAAVPTVNIVSSPGATLCSGKSATLSAGGALSYTWSTTQSTTQIVVSPVVTTTYNVIGKGNNGCTNTAVFTQSVVLSPTISLSPPVSTLCLGKTTTITASGSVLSYSWSTGATLTSININPTITTTYTVEGTANGCHASTSTTVFVVALPVVTITPLPPNICLGESATLTAGGALTYTWDSGSNNIALIVSPGVGTQYTVTGKDANDCLNLATYSLAVSECVGFNELQSAGNEINIFPNPNPGKFTIKLGELSVNVTIDIIDLEGRIVKNMRIKTSETELRVEDLNKGVYFCAIKSDGKTMAVKKLVIE